MIRKILLLVSLFLFFCTTLNQNCAPSLANDLIQTGSYTFTLSVNSQRVQCYNTTINSSPGGLSLAYGISNIQNYDNLNEGVDFSIRGRIDTINQILSFNLITNNQTYGSLSISYLIIKNRQDFFAGSYIADTNQLLGCNPQQTSLIPIPLSSAIPPTNNTLGILIFVNGIRTQSWLFNLKFQQPIIDFSRNQLNLTVLTDAIYPIQTIFFNYLVMDLNKISTALSYSFTTSSVPSDFSITGIIGITNTTSSLQYAYANFNKTNNLACVGFTCTKCISSASCTSQGGTVITNQCVKCSSNSVFNASVGCVCINGYYLINGACSTCSPGNFYNTATLKCVSCGNNANFINGKCTCNNGFYNISGVCQTCPSGTLYSSLLLTCTPICSGGMQWINGNCTCPTGTNLINNVCGICSSGYTYNVLTSTCTQICSGSNQIYYNGQCVCMIGFVASNGICISNSASTTTTGSTNSGNSNAANNGGSSSSNGNSKSSNNPCGANQYLLNGTCKCFSSFIEYQKVCYSCPSNSAPTADQKGCTCNPGYTLITANYSCVAVSPSFTTTTFTSSNSPSSGSGSTSILTSTTTSSTTSSGLNSNSASSNSNSGGGFSLSQSSGFSGQGQGGSINLLEKCPTGTYFTGTVCQACNSYCITCITNSMCISCSSGFNLNSTILNNNLNIFCSQTCGDGKRFILQCDDGNLNNGDGCNSSCNVEAGWACSGGSSSSKDTCSKIITYTSTINLLKNVVFGNALYQNVLISPLPSNFTNNGCPNCPYLLNLTVYSAPSGVIANITFIQNTKYQYVITVIYPNVSSVGGMLVFGVSLNQTYANYFSAADMSQNQYLSINISSMPVLNAQMVTNSIDLNTDHLSEESSVSKDTNSLPEAVLALLNS